jgi:lysophospholipid acyltransferase (LPLAT)-like uncharacterized protein
VSAWKFALVGRVGATTVRAIHATCRVTTSGDEYWRPLQEGPDSRWIGCLWHGTMLSPIWRHQKEDAVVLASDHRDGEYVTRVLSRLGYGIARGSSTRGGARGLRDLLRAARAGHPLAITPDGPQGPREVVKVGAVVLAARSGLPVVPIGVGMSRAWRFSSWDRFAIPKPLARIHIGYGAPIEVPRDVDEAGMDEYVDRLQAGMDETTRAAREAAGEAVTHLSGGVPDRGAAP